MRELRDSRELSQRRRKATDSASSVVLVWQALISFLFHLHWPMHRHLRRYCRCSIVVGVEVFWAPTDVRWALDRSLLRRLRGSSWRRILDEASEVWKRERHWRKVLVERDDCRPTMRGESSKEVRTRRWAAGQRSSSGVSEWRRSGRRSSAMENGPVLLLLPKQSQDRLPLDWISYQLFLCSGQLHFLIDRLLLRDQLLSVLLGESIVPPFIDGVVVQL